MAENKDFAWLRRTLCEEIEAIRDGTSDHNRAKSIAGLAAVALKSVEVEAALRQQQVDLNGTEHAELGALPLCAPALPAPENEEEPTPPGGPRFVAGKAQSAPQKPERQAGAARGWQR